MPPVSSDSTACQVPAAISSTVQVSPVIYINHNFATESEADQALNEETDAQGAKYYHVMLTREPGSNGNMHASADIYQ